MAKETLQRFYMTGLNTALGAGQEAVFFSQGLMPLDGWLVGIDLIVILTTATTNTSVNIFSFGIKTNPEEVKGVMEPAAQHYYDDPFTAYLSLARDAAVFHGSERVMAQYFILLPDQVETPYSAIPIHVRKLFRRGIHSLDKYQLHLVNRTLSGAADVAGVFAIYAETTIVVAPNTWSN